MGFMPASPAYPNQSEQPTRTPTALDALAERWLDTTLELWPEQRVSLGRAGREGEYGDHSPEGHGATADAARSFLAQLDEVAIVDATDRVTAAELRRTLDLIVDEHDANTWRRDLNVIASPAQNIREVLDLMDTSAPEGWAAVAQRLANIPAAVSGYVASLRAGIEADDMPAVRQVSEVAVQVDAFVAEAGYFDQLATRARRHDLGEALHADIDRSVNAARDAYAALAGFLHTELAPVARTDDAVGRDAYTLASRGFLGMTIDLDETYEWGIEELARMEAEQEAIADQIAPGTGILGAIARLNSDPAMTLHGTAELQAWMQDTSDRAVAELGATHFDIPERMRRLECMIAPTHDGGIYYTAPTEDFSRPGRMWWSVPVGVTEFATWRELTTVYHEGVPGHHLQVGLAVHNSAVLNAWRRENWNSAHGEGWALYAERLMDELGYLDRPADRFGMLDAQRMRAARVVVDIGVHLGKPKPRQWFDDDRPWRGDDAFGFMSQHVTMEPEFVMFEVHRYLGWPGQAPSYKVGQREWERLRDQWIDQRATAGAGPDLKRFHAEALGHGGVSLATLAEILSQAG